MYHALIGPSIQSLYMSCLGTSCFDVMYVWVNQSIDQPINKLSAISLMKVDENGSLPPVFVVHTDSLLFVDLSMLCVPPPLVTLFISC